MSGFWLVTLISFIYHMGLILAVTLPGNPIVNSIMHV